MTFFANAPTGLLTKEDLKHSALKGPQKTACLYFQDYFARDGGCVHPQIGNLITFADEIDAEWDPDKGANLVSGLIRFRVDKLEKALEGSSRPKI